MGMKIYVVTSGSYSDYGIEAVYTDRDMAQAYANLDDGRSIEEYDADSVVVSSRPLYAKVMYCTKSNKIIRIVTDHLFHVNPKHPDPDSYCGSSFEFTFWCVLSEMTKKDIEKNGKQSSRLLKAAQDRWAKYKNDNIYTLDEPGPIVTVGPDVMAKVFNSVVVRAGGDSE